LGGATDIGLGGVGSIGLLTTTSPSASVPNTAFAAGVAASTPTYTFTTTPTAPTDIYLRAQDTDNVSSRLTATPATSIEGGVKVVSGQIKISNAYGSELLPLTLMATVQYYTAGGWVNSITDSVTSMTLAANYNVVKNGVTTGTTTPIPTGVAAFVGGQRTIVMGKPTGGATGIATIGPIPVTPGYLLVTPGTATFGVYKSNNSFIYRRESY
jgi:MSHA biogenesis protein MshQ